MTKMKTETKQEITYRQLDYIVEPLLGWYDVHKRSLPWREEVTPYRVWVSEIMLQQTRVEAVKPYFERFLMELPDIASLSKAKEERLLKLWEGLGYYNRVRNMQQAAIQIMEEYEGNMPCEYEELLSLKGIGSYTAGAIASIAFGKPVPAVDGNVLRVLSRLTMDGDDISDDKVKKRVWEELFHIMPKRAGDFNQALMELGATVCIPNGAPLCSGCPWKKFCRAYKEDCVMDYPYKAPKKARKIEEKTLLIIKDGERMLLHKRSAKGLLANMYEFPAMDGWKDEQEILKYVEQLGCKPLFIQCAGENKHIFTHKEWHMKGYLVKVEPFDFEKPKKLPKGFFLVHPDETKDNFPIPSAFRAFME